MLVYEVRFQGDQRKAAKGRNELDTGSLGGHHTSSETSRALVGETLSGEFPVRFPVRFPSGFQSSAQGANRVDTALDNLEHEASSFCCPTCMEPSNHLRTPPETSPTTLEPLSKKVGSESLADLGNELSASASEFGRLLTSGPAGRGPNKGRCIELAPKTGVGPTLACFRCFLAQVHSGRCCLPGRSPDNDLHCLFYRPDRNLAPKQLEETFRPGGAVDSSG